MLFWALLASGQITMRKVDGGRASPRSLPIRSLTSPPDAVTSSRWKSRQTQFQHKSRRRLARSLQCRGSVHRNDIPRRIAGHVAWRLGEPIKRDQFAPREELDESIRTLRLHTIAGYVPATPSRLDEDWYKVGHSARRCSRA